MPGNTFFPRASRGVRSCDIDVNPVKPIPEASDLHGCQLREVCGLEPVGLVFVTTAVAARPGNDVPRGCPSLHPAKGVGGPGPPVLLIVSCRLLCPCASPNPLINQNDS